MNTTMNRGRRGAARLLLGAVCLSLAVAGGAGPAFAKHHSMAKMGHSKMAYQCPMCQMKMSSRMAAKHKMMCPHCKVKLTAMKGHSKHK